MKLKKSLLALTTAATVAVAGTATAVAEEPATNSSSAGQGTQNGENKDETDGTNDENGSEKEEDKDQPLAGSGNKFFGWDEKTEGKKKLTDVVALITTIGALVAGIVTLATNLQKIPNLFK